ncbi:MAG: hypothetical protein IPK84_00900 [Candidatus Moraniibacteriota bacterium]|nr:MAG: hypothetical protein IPK84_00900 [Candidatus Moranbacteria bacterium]
MARKTAAPKAPEKIAPTAAEISVARNGFLKPYSVCFQHLPDNIAREPLGMLAGAMTIQDRSEHSAYIVNFLSSLAKKEYYGNPRRGAIESFEAALHKVNVGLAELAKEGNTEWIGTLDAALCIIERNNLHFSVAGKAKVLLFREKRLSDISEGLADPDNDHPMKTFTDVASGKISPGDRILVTTPEIFSILSETELERSANRLPNHQFEQFLQTAAINQLDISASVFITIGTITEYERKPAPKRTLATVDSIPNAWSHTIFESSKQLGNSIEDTLREKKNHEQDRIDDKTGHIYVTGEAPAEETNETWERMSILLEDISTSIRDFGTRLGRNLIPALLSGARATWSFITSTTSKIIAAIYASRENQLSKISQTAELLSSSTSSKNFEPRHTPLAATKTTFDEQPPSQWSTIPKTFIEKIRRTIHIVPYIASVKQATEHVPMRRESASTAIIGRLFQAGKAILLHCTHILSRLKTFFDTLPTQKQQTLRKTGLAIVGISVIFLLAWTLVTRKESTETTLEESEKIEDTSKETVRELSQDTNIHFVEQSPAIATIADIVSIESLQENVFFITKDAIYAAGSDGENAIRTAYPDGKTAKRGASMPDLGAILILTEDGAVLFFTPATHRFADEHSLLPNAADITNIAASSTYLYALDPADNVLSRYPRAEGGFGPATSWFRESVSIQPESTIAVSDSVFIADTSGIHVYFRGNLQAKIFESSTTPIFPTDIFVTSQENSGQLFILDGTVGRIVRYDVDTGSITAQYAHDALKGATHFSINETTQTAFVSIGDAIHIIDME